MTVKNQCVLLQSFPHFIEFKGKNILCNQEQDVFEKELILQLTNMVKKKLQGVEDVVLLQVNILNLIVLEFSRKKLAMIKVNSKVQET